MRRNTILLGFLLCAAQLALAGNVSEQDARRIALRFMQQKGMHPQQQKGLRAAARHQAPGQSQPDYYVFNAGADGGFVVVSGDDRTAQVLAYGDSGSFPTDSMPQNLRAFMQSYADQIAYLRTRGTGDAVASPLLPGAERARKACKPLLTTLWAQDAPFDQQTPIIAALTSGGMVREHAATGCVATALSQVMNFYRWPTATAAEIPAYKTRKTQRGLRYQREAVPANTPIYWDRMVDDYALGTPSDESKEAVASLMGYVGTSLRMDYDLKQYGSGTFSVLITKALNSYFDYGARYITRSTMTADEFDATVYDEVASRHPVIVGGESTGGGHSFVVDGYDGEGLYHVNWGWGGMSNGYFMLTLLNPNNTTSTGASSTADGYVGNLDAVVGIRPRQAVPQVWGMVDCQKLFMAADGMQFRFSNFTGSDAEFDYALANILPGGKVELLTSVQTMQVGDTEYKEGTIALPQMPADKTFRVVVVSRVHGAADATWGYNENCAVQLSTDSQGAVHASHGNPADYAGIKAEGFSFDKLNIAGDVCQVTFQLRNTGSREFYGPVYLRLNGTVRPGEMLSTTSPSIEAGGSASVTMTFKPKAGTNLLEVFAERACTTLLGAAQVEAVSTVSDGTLATQFKLDGVAGQLTEADDEGKDYSYNLVYGSSLTGTATLTATGGAYTGAVPLCLITFDTYTRFTKDIVDVKSLPVVLTADGQVTVDFSFENVKPGAYVVAFMGTSGMLKSYEKAIVRTGVVEYLADGTRRHVAPTATVTVSQNVVAVDLTGADVQYTAVVPNANRNTLYYLPTGGTTAGLDGRNVVVDGKATAVALSDEGDFFCPQAFTAATVSYTRRPMQARSGKGGWETLSLPFDATSVTSGEQPVEWYRQGGEQGKDLWLMELDQMKGNEAYFGYAATLSAATPYLLGVTDRLKGRDLVFSATDATVYGPIACATATDRYVYRGTMARQPMADAFVLNATGNAFGKQAEGQSMAFRACFTATENAPEGTSALLISTVDEALTGIAEVDGNGAASGTVPVYDLQGRRVATVGPNAPLPTLPKGVYVVNGRKVLVK